MRTASTMLTNSGIRQKKARMRQFRSQWDFWHFRGAVHSGLRYIRTPEHDRFLKTILATSVSRRVVLQNGSFLWRAQLGNCWIKQTQGEETFEAPCAYSAKRMKPLPDRASEGRANAKGIPCLYLSTRKETAMAEVRPWIGSYISLGLFKILRFFADRAAKKWPLRGSLKLGVGWL
jgi:hypothetical protein